MMQVASHCVDAPREHLEQGIAAAAIGDDGRPFNWQQATGGIFRVRCSKHKPRDAALAVKHNDYWFYIPDRDTQSKKTFRLINDIVDLQLKAGVKGGGPILTLPVGK